MSRCFPYPPPGYTRNGIRDEALIQSIKLQREVEKAKKERKKEKKRERKEKEKEKAKESQKVECKNHRHKKRHGEQRNQDSQKGGEHQKRRKFDTEHFEKSSLTEEHGNPAGSQNSTESTLNSNKRQNQRSPSDDRHNSGSIIRIRLPVQRHEDSKVLPSKGQPHTASGKSYNSSGQWRHQPASVPGRVREEPDSVLGVRSDNPSFQQMREPASVPGRVGKQPDSSLGVKSCHPSIQWMHEPASVRGRVGGQPDSSLREGSDNPSIQQMSKPASGPGRVGGQPESSLGVKSLNPSIQWMPEPASVTGREGEEHPCSPSGSTGEERTLSMRKDKSRLSRGASESFTLLPKSSSPSRICRSCSPSLALQFRDLVENWVPPEHEIEPPGLDDESWLFEMNQDRSQNSGTKNCEVGSVGSSYLNSTCWPQAQYLPDADIHALPFTVPF